MCVGGRSKQSQTFLAPPPQKKTNVFSHLLLARTCRTNIYLHVFSLLLCVSILNHHSCRIVHVRVCFVICKDEGGLAWVVWATLYAAWIQKKHIEMWKYFHVKFLCDVRQIFDWWLKKK